MVGMPPISNVVQGVFDRLTHLAGRQGAFARRGQVARPRAGGKRALFSLDTVDCPRCGSANTEQVSAFGSTACKAHHRCLDCREPFEAFKCI